VRGEKRIAIQMVLRLMDPDSRLDGLVPLGKADNNFQIDQQLELINNALNIFKLCEVERGLPSRW
jgi:hypothetical protein